MQSPETGFSDAHLQRLTPAESTHSSLTAVESAGSVIGASCCLCEPAAATADSASSLLAVAAEDMVARCADARMEAGRPVFVSLLS